ncbi:MULTISPECIES: pyridoxamine 5'-phosphate oxidase family protein [unclassified Paraburkholderia]|uniref:pyridoxamine 5'-phosphate oxidase family protein n=1 Tax=unclassified Paraburkholderia TaxID=2615204 RepID=UPI002AB1FBE2|nr:MULTISPECIES: pyridoxamine 5'-phosphate oxidase family protein [unclassified Paraburkholderia]
MNLDVVFTELWRCLANGTLAGHQPFKVMQAATIALDGSPDVRSVVLRTVSESENLITFHTDLRSPKIAQLRQWPRIALAGVDAARNVQIRVAGEVRIVDEGDAKRAAWQRSRQQSLIVYRTVLAPGTPIDQPADAFAEPRPTPDAGFEHFCVVDIRPDALDWLDLSAADGHQRARFVRESGRWSSGWVAP